MPYLQTFGTRLDGAAIDPGKEFLGVRPTQRTSQWQQTFRVLLVSKLFISLSRSMA
jgi:hypothetical protein